MNNLLPKSIRLNLTLLALLGALPVLAVVLLTGLRLRDQAVEDAQAEALRLVRTYADRQESVVLGVKQLLITLATAKEVQQLDAKACTRLFQKLVNENPNHANFALLLPNGDAIASARPFTKSNFSDLKHIVETKKTLDFAAGEYIKGRISGEPVIAFSYPVRGPQGELIAIIATSLRLASYETLFKSAMMPEQSALVITDRSGIRLFVFPAREKYGLGERISSKAMLDFYGASEEGYLYTTAQDGVRRYYAFRQLRLSSQSPPYLVLAVGIPEGHILARADNLTKTYLLWLAVAACLSLGLAWLVGEYGIIQRISQFAKLASRVGRGDYTATSGMSESRGALGVVAKAFNDMVLSLRAREAERDAAKQAQEHSGRLFQRLFHEAPVGLCFVNKHGVLVDFNSRFITMFGYTHEDVPTLAEWWQLAYPDPAYRAWVIETWNAAVARAAKNCTDIEQIEYKISCKDGSERLMLISGIVIGDDFLAVFFDVTERKRSENALKAALEETNTIFEAMGHPVMVLNTSFDILKVNAATENALGIRSDDIVGKKCHTLFHCTDSPPNGCPAKDLLSRVQDGPVQMEQEALGRKFLVYCTPVFDAAGRIDKIIHMSTDITELKATQASLTAAKEAAEAANRAKSAFLANMSHEIRTPLNGVLGMLHLIKTNTASSNVECYAEMATRAGRRLTSLLGDILDLSRIEAGRLPIKAQPFTLANIFVAISETFSPLHMSKSLSLAINVSPDVPTDLIGDEIRVRQILFNLVGNAVKFTEKGEVRLDVSPLAPLPSGMARVLFVVSDTGQGIPEEKINMICSPFTQVSEEFTRSHQGAGLGLSIAQHLVDAMGGTLTFDSTVGQGTSVYMTLPFGIPEQCSLPTTQQLSDSEVKTSPLRILLVEDEEINRISTRLNLEKIGHHVATANNGEEAVKALQGSTYDCVLMDIQMDIMDGVEATRRIRSGSSGVLDAKVPIIAMTAYALAGDRENFLEVGMNDYVSKPINLDELKKALAHIAKKNP